MDKNRLVQKYCKIKGWTNNVHVVWPLIYLLDKIGITYDSGDPGNWDRLHNAVDWGDTETDQLTAILMESHPFLRCPDSVEA